MSHATTTSPVPWLVLLWLVAGVSLAVAHAPGVAPPIAPMFTLGSVALAAIAYRARGGFRAWADGLPLRPLLAAHAIRIVIGALFLYEYAHDRLPGTFAIRGGYGDIAVGLLALVAAAVPRRRLVVAFSLIGLADIVLVFGTAMYLLLVAHAPGMQDAISGPPYALLPLAVVPAVISSHLLVLARRGA
jgi:hypothetical protein